MANKTPEPKDLDPFNVALGERLRAARDARGLTQRRAADKIGCDPQNLSKVERGEQSPSLRLVAAACQALAISSDWLILGRGRPPQPGTADDDDGEWPSLERFISTTRVTPSEVEHLKRASLAYSDDPGEGVWMQHLGIVRSMTPRKL